MDAILYSSLFNSIKSLDVVYCEFIEDHSQRFENGSVPAADFRKFNPPAEYSYVYVNALITTFYDGNNIRPYASSGLGVIVSKVNSVNLPCVGAQYSNGGIGAAVLPRTTECTINFESKYFSYIEKDFDGSNNARTYYWPGIQFIYFA